MKKNRETIMKDVELYLKKTSRHLFKSKNGVIFKIEVFKRDDKLFYTKIYFIKSKLLIETKEALSDNAFNFYGTNYLSVLKDSIFEKSLQNKSIKYFKKMRSIINILMSNLDLNNKIDDKILKEVENSLNELEWVS